MDRRISAKYFTIVEGDIGPSLEDALGRIQEIDRRADRERRLADDVVLRLEHLETRGGLIIGDLTRIQSENLPGFPDDEMVNPLRDDKLGHGFGFTYNPETRTMCLQNLQSAQVGKVIQYFSAFNNDSVYSQLPILNQAMIDMLEDKTIVKLDISIAHVGRFIEAANNNDSVAVRMARAASTTETKSLSFVMTAHPGDELDRAMVRRVAQESYLASLTNRSVKRVRVSTREYVQPLDFMGGHLSEGEVLDLPANEPAASRQIRLERLRSWHIGKMGYLRTYVEND